MQRLASYYHRLRRLLDEPGPREDRESTVVISDCLIRGLEDGSLLFCAVDGGPLSRLTISHCNLDGAGFLEYESKTMFAIHWDIDLLLSCDATIRIYCERTQGTDDRVDAELEDWLGEDA